MTSGKMLETSDLGICCKKECPSSSFNDVDGDEIVKANMDGDDTPSQSNQNDQEEEEEEIEEDKEFIIRKPASKKLKPLPAQFPYLSDACENVWKKTKLVT